MSSHFPNDARKHFMNSKHAPHLAWLLCLHEIMGKARRHGLLAIEYDVSIPESTGSAFLRHPALLLQPYRDFARDLLRLRLGGFDDMALMETYAQEAIATLTKRNWLGLRRADPTLLKTIWLTLRAFCEGWAPAVACDFGRQAIPAHLRPDFDTLENLLIEARRMADNHDGAVPDGPRDLAVEAEQFIASLNKPSP